MAQLTTLDRASWPKLAHIGPATNPLFSPTSLTPYTTNPLLSLTNARRKPSSIPPPVPSTRPPPAESAPPHAGRGGGGPSGVLWIDLPSRVGKEALTFNRLLIFPAGVFLCGEPSNPSLSAAPLTRPVCASAWWSFQSDYLCLQEILVGLSALTDEAMTTCCVGWGSCRLRAMHRRETKTSQRLALRVFVESRLVI